MAIAIAFVTIWIGCAYIGNEIWKCQYGRK